jgi:hypothetical protein
MERAMDFLMLGLVVLLFVLFGLYVLAMDKI